MIVAMTAAAATLGHARAGHERWRVGLGFGVAGIVASFGGTALKSQVDPILLLVCFAALMLAAAVAMLAETRAGYRPGRECCGGSGY